MPWGSSWGAPRTSRVVFLSQVLRFYKTTWPLLKWHCQERQKRWDTFPEIKEIITTKNNVWALIESWIGKEKKNSYEENWRNNWEIGNVDCILVKKVDSDRILSDDGIRCLGVRCHYTGNFQMVQKRVCVWEKRAQVWQYCELTG